MLYRERLVEHGVVSRIISGKPIPPVGAARYIGVNYPCYESGKEKYRKSREEISWELHTLEIIH